MERPDIHDLWVSLNRPSPDRFALALKKRGIPARASDLGKFTKNVGARQIFAPPPRLKGRVYSTGKDDSWMADIIVNTHMPSEHNGTKYGAVLVARDVFTRYAFAELMTTQSDATRAMEAIFQKAQREGHRLPTQLVTDEDGVFKAPSFRALIQKYSIIHTFKEARNDISTVDRLIGLLRRGSGAGVRAVRGGRLGSEAGPSGQGLQRESELASAGRVAGRCVEA